MFGDGIGTPLSDWFKENNDIVIDIKVDTYNSFNNKQQYFNFKCLKIIQDINDYYSKRQLEYVDYF